MARPSNGSVDAVILEATSGAIKALLEQRAETEAQIERINVALTRLGFDGRRGTGKRIGRPPGSKGKVKGERIRRSPEQLAKDAGKIAAYLKAHPESPAKAIREVADFGLDLKAFLKKHGDTAVKVTGQKAGTKYSLA